MGLSGNTTSLLASGVVGIVMFVCTIPAVLWVDKVGRKPLLISGALVMGLCHFIVAGILGGYSDNIGSHKAAGWVAVVFIWVSLAPLVILGVCIKLIFLGFSIIYSTNIILIKDHVHGLLWLKFSPWV